jgi:hypothetical protein
MGSWGGCEGNVDIDCSGGERNASAAAAAALLLLLLPLLLG